MKPAIKLENISKQYRLGTIGTGTLSHDVNRWWQTKILRNEDPYLKIGETNDRSTKGNSEYVWALKDINLEVNPGEILGIIGKNGAGKSTLLKLLSRVTAPTTGSIKTRGRIASLLEVGTGFHPELTGRENIYLNGAILGMTKREIALKLDEIVDFSGCERYIDTPVKRYSSGMTVRLGFAVAAFLEPEILVVDEVLAVGDAEFQKKAIGKMKDVSENHGRTVLFVSHNLTSINKLCPSLIVMDKGSIAFKGKVSDGLDFYGTRGVISSLTSSVERNYKNDKTKKAVINSIRILDENQLVPNVITKHSRIFISIEFIVLKKGIGYNFGIEVWSNRSDCIFTSKYWDKSPESMNEYEWLPGKYLRQVELPIEILKGGKYYMTSAASIPLKEMIDVFPEEIGFVIEDYSSPIFISQEERNGITNPILNWNEVV
jgi:lipopolysaccharide transport system ATP-binding protein